MKSISNRVLVIRLSALGDVAMTAPVLYSVVQKYPEIKFTMLTRPNFKPIFDPIEGLEVKTLDVDRLYKNAGDLASFVRAVHIDDYDVILDLHNVLRSKTISATAKIKRKAVFTLDKNRSERQKIIKGKRSIDQPLRPMVENYAMVFAQAGFPLEEIIIDPKIYSLDNVSLPDQNSSEYKVGLAPFARYTEKSLPIEKIAELISQLNQRNVIPYLFGGGDQEYQRAESLVLKLNAINLINKNGLAQDISLISDLDMMISMDSANMHLARLTETVTITVWGGTHPALGFGGWSMAEDDHFIIAPESLSCQPCSVFGNKPCARKDLACLNHLDMGKLADKVINRLKLKNNE